MPRPLIVILYLLSLLLAGCGQKGPLYLPQPEPQSAASEPEQEEQQH